MMWWGSGSGRWWVGALFMLFCMLIMVRMMGHGRAGHHGHGDHGGHGWADDPERTLANRLADGRIDVAEYERLLDALRRPVGSAAPRDLPVDRTDGH